MKKMLKCMLVPAIALSGAVAACNSGNDTVEAITRRDSAGVTIVEAAEPSAFLDWSVTERWRVGNTDDELTSFTSLGPMSFGVDSSENIYILNRAAKRVVVLDANGEVLWAMGGSGGGPGEFQFPAGLAVSPGGALAVKDFGKNGLVTFDADGVPQTEIHFEAPTWAGFMGAGPDGWYVEQYNMAVDSLVRHVSIATPDSLVPITNHVFSSPTMTEIPGCAGLSIPLGKLYEPALRWSAVGKRIAEFIGPAYAVDVYDDGRRSFSLRMELPDRPVTREMAMGFYRDGFRVNFGGNSCEADVAEVVDAQGYADFLPAVAGVLVAASGEIWVARQSVAGESVPIDIWSVEGELIGTLAPGMPMPAALVGDHGFVTVQRDDLDVPSVVMYDLSR